MDAGCDFPAVDYRLQVFQAGGRVGSSLINTTLQLLSIRWMSASLLPDFFMNSSPCLRPEKLLPSGARKNSRSSPLEHITVLQGGYC